LAFAYAVPASFTVATVTLTDIWKGTGTDLLAGGLIGMVAIGPVTHAFHRNGRGTARAFLGNSLSMVGGFIVGAVIGGNQPTHSSCTDVSSCEFQNAFYGALLGAAAGSLIWGTFDVIYNAETPPRRPKRALVSSLQPVVGTNQAGSHEVQGLTVHLLGTF
jgi:hypothetical protein